ncbi:hypothetical protein CRUP_037496 [Coryphaenoides rupestris]|nr:hypothetical protein CRUP_037496 [Coryphaenoides rupestris]
MNKCCIQIYPVLAPATRTRLALVITNVTFDHLGVRNGAEKDEQTIKKLLCSLGYIVAMDKAVKDFFEDPRLPSTDSVFVVIMSHGKMGGILGVHHASDEKPDVFPIDNIYKHMDPKKCGGLRNKPKVIIIQACRGGVLVSFSFEPYSLPMVLSWSWMGLGQSQMKPQECKLMAPRSLSWQTRMRMKTSRQTFFAVYTKKKT